MSPKCMQQLLAVMGMRHVRISGHAFLYCMAVASSHQLVQTRWGQMLYFHLFSRTHVLIDHNCHGLLTQIWHNWVCTMVT